MCGETFPALWLGVNFLAVTGKLAFPVLGKLKREGIAVDGYWADDARIDERRAATTRPRRRTSPSARAASRLERALHRRHLLQEAARGGAGAL